MYFQIVVPAENVGEKTAMQSPRLSQRKLCTMSETGKFKTLAVLVGLFFVVKDSGGLYLLGQKIGRNCKNGQSDEA
jgi:hypothetical protein